jgi:hypothetical protein
MEAACAGIAQNASQSAAIAETILIARKLPARGGGFKKKWTGLSRAVGHAKTRQRHNENSNDDANNHQGTPGNWG